MQAFMQQTTFAVAPDFQVMFIIWMIVIGEKGVGYGVVNTNCASGNNSCR